MRTLPILLALLLLAAPEESALADTSPESAPADSAGAASAAKKDERRARKMLADKVFIRFTETGSIGNESSLDQRLHLCRSRDYVYDSVSYARA